MDYMESFAQQQIFLISSYATLLAHHHKKWKNLMNFMFFSKIRENSKYKKEKYIKKYLNSQQNLYQKIDEKRIYIRYMDGPEPK